MFHKMRTEIFIHRDFKLHPEATWLTYSLAETSARRDNLCSLLPSYGDLSLVDVLVRHGLYTVPYVISYVWKTREQEPPGR